MRRDRSEPLLSIGKLDKPRRDKHFTKVAAFAKILLPAGHAEKLVVGCGKVELDLCLKGFQRSNEKSCMRSGLLCSFGSIT